MGQQGFVGFSKFPTILMQDLCETHQTGNKQQWATEVTESFFVMMQNRKHLPRGFGIIMKMGPLVLGTLHHWTISTVNLNKVKGNSLSYE